MAKITLLGIISLFVLASNHKTSAQTFPEKELIGTWVVTKLENQMSESEIQPDQKEMMRKVEKAFLDSKIIFQSDKNCALKLPFEEMAIKNGHWRYDQNTNRIIIQEWKDKDKSGSVLIGLQVVTRAERIFFIVEETPIILEVKKI